MKTKQIVNERINKILILTDVILKGLENKSITIEDVYSKLKTVTVLSKEIEQLIDTESNFYD